MRLGAMGFSPDEIRAMTDTSGYADHRQSETAELVDARLAAAIPDPATRGRFVHRFVADLEAQLFAAGARRNRRFVIALSIVLVLAAAIGVVVWLVRSRVVDHCAALVDVPQAEAIAGIPLETTFTYAGKYHCSRTLEARGARGRSIATIRVERPELAIDSTDRDKYVDEQRFSVASGEAVLLVAGEAREVSSDELLASAQSRRGRSHDPMGAALAALPARHHRVRLRTADHVVVLELDRTTFSVEQARRYAEVVGRHLAD